MKIYVQLLEEGTVVYKPVEAIAVGDGFFKISPDENHDPKLEKWEYVPGEIVKCEEKILENEKVMVAKRKNQDTHLNWCGRFPCRGGRGAP